MKKYLKIATTFILAVLLCIQPVLPVKAWEEIITCTVLGDSIAKGYSSDKVNKIKCYGRIVTEQLAEENGTYFDYQNYAKNGLDTKGLNEQILSRDTVKRCLNKSDIVLLTMGSNDLLNEFKTVAQEILNSDTKFRSANQALGELKEGVKKNPLIVFKIVDALSNWDYASFEKQWIHAMEIITQQKKDGSQIIVTNIYNPLYNTELPGTLNKVVANIIKNMNSIIDKRAADYGYEVVNLFDSSIAAFVQGDGLHPSQEGQQLIAELVYKMIEDPAEQREDPQSEDTSLEDAQLDDSQFVDGEAIKGKDDSSAIESEIKQNQENSSIQTETGQNQDNSTPKTETGQNKDSNAKKSETKENSKQKAQEKLIPLSILAVILMLITGIRIYKKYGQPKYKKE